MGWPQRLLAGLLVLEVVGGFLLHGHARPPVDFATKVLETACLALLLHAGGFWK